MIPARGSVLFTFLFSGPEKIDLLKSKNITMNEKRNAVINLSRRIILIEQYLFFGVQKTKIKPKNFMLSVNMKGL